MELYLRTLTVVKICIIQCGVLMLSKRVLFNIWGNIFVICLERKAVEFYVGFNWLRWALLGYVYEKAEKSSILIKADCHKTRAWSTSVCKELLLWIVWKSDIWFGRRHYVTHGRDLHSKAFFCDQNWKKRTSVHSGVRKNWTNGKNGTNVFVWETGTIVHILRKWITVIFLANWCLILSF